MPRHDLKAVAELHVRIRFLCENQRTPGQALKYLTVACLIKDVDSAWLLQTLDGRSFASEKIAFLIYLDTSMLIYSAVIAAVILCSGGLAIKFYEWRQDVLSGPYLGWDDPRRKEADAGGQSIDAKIP